MAPPSRSETELFEEAFRLFQELCELDDEERSRGLSRACGDDEHLRRRVEALLDADRHRRLALEGASPGRLGAAAAAEPPATIGRYRVLRLLGAGGMGVVYEAEQESPRRRVALKLVRADLFSAEHLRRFEQEARVLGALNHPGIAQIHEAGTADAGHGPQPFFAMELVEGVPLDRFARERRLGTRARLELLAQVCDAVHHAHERGIVHRDLKPGNVLVDASGRPRVLDFGVARVTDADLEVGAGRTGAGELLGTLPYMSPEQVRADDVDARADVYALGVMAYELLAGVRPFDLRGKPLPEAARTILEDEPSSLGGRDRALRGDLETIVHKALSKERERRYGSAAELAADLRRYLADQPIVARPATRLYQLRKFARRNRVLVGGAAAVFVVLAAGAATSTVLFLRAEGQRKLALEALELADDRLAEVEAARRAEATQLARALEAEARALAEGERSRVEAETARAVADFLEQVFVAPDPAEARGATITARELLERGARRIEDELEGLPEIRARLMRVMGRVHLGLGLYERAEELLGQAIAIRRERGERSAELASALSSLGEVHHYCERLPVAEPLYREALELRLEVLGERHEDVAESLDLLGRLLRDRGDLAGAEDLHQRALAIRSELFGERSAEAAESLQSLAMLAFLRSDLARSEELYRRCLELRREASGDADHNLPELLHGLAIVRSGRGDLDGAEALLLESLAAVRRIYGEEHAFQAHAYVGLARVTRARGDAEGAEALYQEALALLDQDDGLRAIVLNDHAVHRSEQGDLAGAQVLLEEALAAYRSRLGADHNHIAIALGNLARLHEDQGRLDQAAELLGEAIAMQRRLFDEPTETLAISLENQARVLSKAGELDDAAAALREALELRERVHGPTDRRTLGVAARLAELSQLQGRPAEAR